MGAAFDLKHKRVQASLSQLQLSLRSRVSRWRLRSHESGIIQLRDDELKRIMIVLKHATRAARSNAAAEERAVSEALREYEKQAARSSEVERSSSVSGSNPVGADPP